jgi:hypothetical protein
MSQSMSQPIPQSMIGTAESEPTVFGVEDPDRHQLAQENSSLRILVAELLRKNQYLRWALETTGYDPSVLITPEGTPFRKN